MLIKSNILFTKEWYTMSKNESHIYMILSIMYNEDKGACWPGYRTISKIAKMSKKCISTCLKSLEYKGFITIVRSKGMLNNYIVKEIGGDQEGTTLVVSVINKGEALVKSVPSQKRGLTLNKDTYDHISNMKEELRNDFFRDYPYIIEKYNRTKELYEYIV